MIRIDQQESGASGTPAAIGIPHHRIDRNETGYVIETEYCCGCKSHDPYAPDHCQTHGDPIRLTRITYTNVSRFG